MGKDQKRVSDILRSVRNKSVMARVNPSVALARFWKSQGVELTDKQILQIQLIDQQFKPQTILREWSRQNRRETYERPRASTVAGIEMKHDHIPLIQTFTDPKPLSPRKKFLGIF